MKKEIEILINAWYQEWLKTNDPYQVDFEYGVIKLLPNINMTYDLQFSLWILL